MMRLHFLRTLRRKPNKIELIAHITLLALILALGTWLRLDGIGHQGLWADELSFIPNHAAEGALANIYRHERSEFPLEAYLRIASLKAGNSEAIYRASNVAFSLLGLYLIAGCMIRWSVTPFVSLSTVGLVAFSPYSVIYGREARYYSLCAILGLLMCIAVIMICREGLWRQRRTFSFAQAWALTAGASLFLLIALASFLATPLSFIVPAAGGATLATIFLIQSIRIFQITKVLRVLGVLLLLGLGTLLAFGSILPQVLRGIQAGKSSQFIQEERHTYKVSLGLYAQNLQQFLSPQWAPLSDMSDNQNAMTLAGAVLVALLLGGCGVAFASRRFRAIGIPLSLMAVVMFVGMPVLVWGQSFYHVRYASPGLYPVYMLLAIGLWGASCLPLMLIAHRLRPHIRINIIEWACIVALLIPVGLHSAFTLTPQAVTHWSFNQPWRLAIEASQSLTDKAGLEYHIVIETHSQSSRLQYLQFYLDSLDLRSRLHTVSSVPQFDQMIAAAPESQIFWYLAYAPRRGRSDFLESHMAGLDRQGRGVSVYINHFQMIGVAGNFTNHEPRFLEVIRSSINDITDRRWRAVYASTGFMLARKARSEDDIRAFAEVITAIPVGIREGVRVLALQTSGRHPEAVELLEREISRRPGEAWFRELLISSRFEIAKELQNSAKIDLLIHEVNRYRDEFATRRAASQGFVMGIQRRIITELSVDPARFATE